MRSVCQFSCNAAQCGQTDKCARANCCSGLSASAEPKSNPAVANSSQFITASPHPDPLTTDTGAPRNIAQYFQFCQQQRPAPVQTRPDRSYRTIQRFGRFLVTQFFQFAQDNGFAKFHW